MQHRRAQQSGCSNNTACDEENRHCSGLHAQSNTGHNVGGVARLGLFSDAVHWGLVHGAVVGGNQSDQNARCQTDNRSDSHVSVRDRHSVDAGIFGPELIGENKGHNSHDTCGSEGACVESMLSVAALFDANDEGSEDRTHDACGSNKHMEA